MAAVRALQKLSRYPWQLAARRAYMSPGTEEVVIKDQATSVEIVASNELVRIVVVFTCTVVVFKCTVSSTLHCCRGTAALLLLIIIL